MRREPLYAAIEEVGTALRASRLAHSFGELLLPAASDDLNRRRAAALSGLKQYVISAQRYSDSARELSRILKLEQLEETELWLEVLSLGQAPERRLREWQQRIQFVEEELPRVAGLFRPEALRALMEPAGDEEPVFTDDALLTVIVIERERQYSSPRRLTEVFESVSLLYDACAEIEDVPAGHRLTVLSCDSGVDKSFDFLGSAAAIETAKEVLLSLWDSVVLHRGHKLANRLELIARDLPVIQRIRDLEEHGKLAPEQAEGLRRRISEAAAKFISGGAMIPEIERLSYSPRELMAPSLERTEATGSADSGAHPVVVLSNGNGKAHKIDLDNLSEPDRGAVQRLLGQARAESADEDSGQFAAPGNEIEAPD